MDIPVFGALLRRLNVVPVDRDGGGGAGLKAILDRLLSGGVINTSDTTGMADFDAIIDDMNLIHPEFILHTGDLVNEGGPQPGDGGRFPLWGSELELLDHGKRRGVGEQAVRPHRARERAERVR